MSLGNEGRVLTPCRFAARLGKTRSEYTVSLAFALPDA